LKLSVSDRILLLNILPKEGNLLDLRIVRDLHKSLSFTETEHAALQFVVTDNQIQWNREADQGADIEIGPKAISLTLASLEALNAASKLKLEHLDLMERLEEAAKPNVAPFPREA
jgi:hypothetical protein